MWGALATSDFHSEPNGDYWPCQFSATWIYARERSAVAALEALRSGSFAGVHGGLARGVQLTLAADGLSRAAIAGEAVRLRPTIPVTVEIRAEVPATDWAGQANRVDLVELFGVGQNGTRVLHSGPLVDGVLRHAMPLPAGQLTIRARGRRIVEDGPDLLFYTNAIDVQ